MPGRAEEFAAEKRDRAGSFEDLDEAIAWGEFDAAINCTPDGVHKATTLALIAAGKHVFCEKPLAPSYADALAMTEAAEARRPGQHGQPDLPQLAGAAAGAQDGRGRRRSAQLRHVEAAYRQSWLCRKAWGDWR